MNLAMQNVVVKLKDSDGGMFIACVKDQGLCVPKLISTILRFHFVLLQTANGLQQNASVINSMRR